MEKKSVVFLGSKPIGYHCLDYMLQQAPALHIEVKGILTQENANFGEGYSLRQLAESHQVPVISSLSEMPEVDILYSVQYHEILKQQDINKANQIAVNLHMAPLPEYRGCNQFSFAILDQKTEFGTTIHRMDAGIDHGDILFEQRFPIPEQCWVNDLYQLTFDASLNLFQRTLTDIINGNYTPIPQLNYEPLRGSSMHYRKEIKAIKELDISWDKEKIHRHIRATAMPGFEPPYFLMGDQKIYCSKTWQ
ncbi:MAG: hypothetical protein JNJ58_08225 [Chitinophagaceae bacterium]|nr:hypothetical protein [Chitinophagaceae bacterium]